MLVPAEGPIVKWHLFIGARVVAAGLSLPSGAPLPAVAAGIALAALWQWKAARPFGGGGAGPRP